MNIIRNKFKRYFLNPEHTRWVNMDDFGTKDKIVLKTTSGRLETRTCQYWATYIGSDNIPKAKITYKGKRFFVTLDTILVD